MIQKSKYIIKLGLFVLVGLLLTTAAIYLIGKNKNLFGETFQLQATFRNVGGLKVGNMVRLSGINIGSVKEIGFTSDSTVVVLVSIREEVRRYIKTDAMASIGSDGLMGDKVMTITPGGHSSVVVQNNAFIVSSKAVELDDILKSVKVSVDNAQIITRELAAFTGKMNNKNSMLSKLVNDDKMGKSLDATLSNIKSATKGLDENMEAAKHNFLLRGYFKKKEKEKAQQIEEDKKEQERIKKK
jgi:phospholipid/cholesterol/gamma-HCH transport system substrate-binding protein